MLASLLQNTAICPAVLATVLAITLAIGGVLFLRLRRSRIAAALRSSMIHDETVQTRAAAERNRLAAALEQAGDNIIITDIDGNILYVNAMFETMTGYTRDEAIGKKPSILKSGKYGQEFYSELWQTITAGSIWSGQIINKNKNGSLYTEETTISPMRDETGRIVNFVAVKRDISNQISLHRQMQQMQKMESVGRLASGVAHDFNNILGGIIGYAELCEDELSEDHPAREYLLTVS